MLCAQVQNTILQAVATAVSKYGEPACMLPLVKALSEKARVDVSNLSIENVRVDSMSVHEKSQLFPQAALDFKALRVLAEIVSGERVSSEVRLQAKALLKKRNKLSVQLRSLIALKGKRENHLAKAWEAIEKCFPNPDVPHGEIEREARTAFEGIQPLCAFFRSLDGDGVDVLYGAVVDLLGDHRKKIEAFAEGLCGAAKAEHRLSLGESDSAMVETIANEVVEKLASCVAKVLEASGHFADVLPPLYYPDSTAEAREEAEQKISWLQASTDVLCRFTPCCEPLRHLARCCAFLGSLHAHGEKTMDEFEEAKSLSKLFMEEVALPRSAVAVDNEDVVELPADFIACCKKTVAKLGSKSVAEHVDRYFMKLMTPRGVETLSENLVKVLKDHEDLLPPKCSGYNLSLKSVLNAKDACNRIKSYSAPTLTECTQILSGLVTADAPLQSVPAVLEWKSLIVNEWKAGVATLLKTTDGGTVASFIRKYECIKTIAEDVFPKVFRKPLEWIANYEVPPDRLEEFQQIEQMVDKLLLNEGVLDAIGSRERELPKWISEEEIAAILERKNAMPTFKKQVHEAAIITANVLVSNILVTEPKRGTLAQRVEKARKHFTGKLKVSVEELTPAIAAEVRAKGSDDAKSDDLKTKPSDEAKVKAETGGKRETQATPSKKLKKLKFTH